MTRCRSIASKDDSSKIEDDRAEQAQNDHLQRILAGVNHDLRQPLQTMELLCGVLISKTKDEEVLKVAARLKETLSSATSILAALPNVDRSKTVIVYPEYYNPSSPKASQSEERSVSPPAGEVKLQSPSIFIVEDDREVLDAMGDLFNSHGYSVELFESCEQFLAAIQPDRKGCLLVDALFPGMSGLELLRQIKNKKYPLQAIMITGRGDIALAVQAMKAGAADFIEKPVNHEELLKIITEVTEQNKDSPRSSGGQEAVPALLSRLSARERQVMEMVLEGHPNKNIAADLGISQRTVETYRAKVMKKMGAKSLPALVRMTLAATTFP